MTGQEALRTMSAQGFGQPGMAEPRRAFNTSRLRNTARLYSRPALGCPGQRRRRAPGAERLHQLRQPPPRPHDLHTVECPVADVVGIGQDRHMRRRQPVPAGQRSPRYRRSPEHSLWAATVTRIPSREPSRSADLARSPDQRWLQSVARYLAWGAARSGSGAAKRPAARVGRGTQMIRIWDPGHRSHDV
jgi:hypothetical protein